MRDKLGWALAIIASMAIGAGIVVGIDSVRPGRDSRTAIADDRSPASTSSNNGVVAETIPDDVADLYEAIRPSVVRITGQSNRGAGEGLGSGIVLDKNGHILTNNHVVSGFDQIDVTLSDGTAATARVVGSDPGNDLAVIEADLPSDKLKPAKLGDSSKLRTGEFVIAVGNPFGIEGSLTTGVVSGLGRTLSGGTGRPLRQLIQSDAAINPGNSGGGLFNKRGEVVGITTAIENPSGDRVFVGIGYAVPINVAQRFMPAMLAGRQIEHPRMGVGLDNLTPAAAARFGLNVQQGVMITLVEPNSAAARAGLRASSGTRPGDVIVSIDSKEVKTFEDLANYIDSKNVGDRVTVKVFRDGREMSVDLTLEPWRSANT